MAYLWVALGGALGSMARYGFGSLAGRWWGVEFPYAALGVNIVGSFLMGILAGMLARTTSEYGADLRLFLAVGVLGGFTTFSAFSLDAWLLLEQGKITAAVLYIALSVILSIAALAGGLFLLKVIP